MKKMRCRWLKSFLLSDLQNSDVGNFKLKQIVWKGGDILYASVLSPHNCRIWTLVFLPQSLVLVDSVCLVAHETERIENLEFLPDWVHLCADETDTAQHS